MNKVKGHQRSICGLSSSHPVAQSSGYSSSSHRDASGLCRLGKSLRLYSAGEFSLTLIFVSVPRRNLLPRPRVVNS